MYMSTATNKYKLNIKELRHFKGDPFLKMSATFYSTLNLFVLPPL